MDTLPGGDKASAAVDTGQNSTAEAAAASPTRLSAGEDFVNNQDGLRDTVMPSDKTLQSSLGEGDGLTASVLSEDECVSLEDSSCVERGGCGSGASDGLASLESLDHSAVSEGKQEATVNLVNSKPKIIVEMAGDGRKEVEMFNEEDLDPLITIDDSESQSSDLINFDTVSYDVIHQTGAEDEDDDRSLATMSSMSCDFKMDSPAKHSHGSNSSSLINLLDSSVKETVGIAPSPSAQITENGPGSAVSSCPSSPSSQSSKTASSAVDGSVSEGVDLLQARALPDNQLTDTSLANCVSLEALEEKNNILNDYEINSNDILCDSTLDINVNETSLQMMSSESETNFDITEKRPKISCDELDRSDLLSVCVEPVAKEPEVLDSSMTLPSSGSLDNFDDSNNVINAVVYIEEVNALIPSVMPCPIQENASSSGDEIVSTTPVQMASESLNVPETLPLLKPSEEEIAVIAGVQELSPVSSMPVEQVTFDDSCVDSSVVSSTSEELITKDNKFIHNGVIENSIVTSSAGEETLETDAVNVSLATPTSLGKKDISLEESIPSSTTSLSCGEASTSYLSDKVEIILEEQSGIKIVDTTQQVGTSSPDTSVSNCLTSEDASILKACGSPNESAELNSLEEPVFSPKTLSVEQIEATATESQPSSEKSDSPLQSSTPSGAEKSCVSSTLPTDSVRSSFQINVKSGDSSPDHIQKISSEEELQVVNQTETCNAFNLNLESEKKSTETESVKSLEVCQTSSQESHGSKNKRPTTLPKMNSTKSEKPCMNFTELLGFANPGGSSASRQHSAAALDEAQQVASGLVDTILQTAVLKAEEKLIDSKNSTIRRVEAIEAAHALVDEVLIEASAQASQCRDKISEASATCDTSICEKEFSSLASPETDEPELNVIHPSIESTLNHALLHSDGQNGISTSIPVSKSSSLDDCSTSQSDSALPKETSPPLSQSDLSVKSEQDHLVMKSAAKEEPCSSSNLSSEVEVDVIDKCVLKSLNQSGENSSSVSSTDTLPQIGSARTSSPENGATDSARSSLVTCSDSGLRSEASLFVDGVLEEAVKKYEESSSSESSPVKLKKLVIDPDFLQEDEELATPCGEMLTEHFMDFESGRNVSVFCTLPESGSEDHLYAYDRTAHTIGNREVDSGTGKSVSVFRVEEDVYYEIQRASTCTSVFESVEEEDEDMIDTTVPVEDRPRTMKNSLSFPSFDRDKLEISDSDAFEDAVGAFLNKERLARDEMRHTSESNPCRALVLKHPEIDLSNREEKKRMAEKWANGGESEVPDTPEMREKQRAIREALDSNEDVSVKLCKFALTEGGLINDSLRREAWPRMLGLDPTVEIHAPSLDDLKSHPEYGQVVLDVNRSLKRFPPDIPKDQRETLQDKLTRLIMYVISKHPHLRYYQGYHDVAVTFLLVVGESVAFQIMERLSTENLSDCMQPTMERTSYLLHFIYPLLHRIHPTLADYLERSEVGTMFCLPWFLTWFGHSLDRYQDVVRLYDHFLASPPLAPLYVAAVLVAHRADEVLSVDCDMAAVHALLSHIPDSLPLEILLRDATELYLKFPPESIEREVEERFRNEQEMRNHEINHRNRLVRHRRHASHGGGGASWQLAEVNRFGGTMMAFNRWMPPWVVQQQRLSMRLLFASATFFVGFYVYSRGGDMLPYL